jgi:hypothetical protein
VNSPPLRSSEVSGTEQALLHKLRIDRNGHRYRGSSLPACESCRWLRVRILRQIAHLRSYTLLFALADVPEDHRTLSQRTSAIDSERQRMTVRNNTPNEYLSIIIDTNEIP